MLLVIAGLVLFSLLAININKTIANSSEQTDKAAYLAMATSIGQNLINRISSKAFDQGTISNPPYSAGILTPAASLGPEAGETPGTYNDVDDFNGYLETDTTAYTGIFHSSVLVNYVSESNPDSLLTNSTSRTKRIEVLVANNFMPDTVKLYYYKSY